jgi:pSer/pThr/pTyr-binding forkhead associated (FHA) protein
MARKAESAAWPGEMTTGISSSIPVRLHEAWLVVGDGGGQTLPLALQVTRIGRHQDNDVRLADPSVHRYHAVIERTSGDEFVIADLSGKEGNGVRINGERHERAHLVDGDMIELGRTRLKFESVPI